MSLSVQHFPRERGPDATPACPAQGRARCGQVPILVWQVPTDGGSYPTTGWQVPTMGCWVPCIWWQVPLSGDRSPWLNVMVSLHW